MTQTVTLELPKDLSPGERYSWTFQNTVFNGKKGYLYKFGPWAGVVFDNYSNLKVRGEASGMASPVPADSARTLDSNSIPKAGFVAVENPQSNSNVIPSQDFEVILFGKQDEASERRELQFSGQAVISDLIPGVVTNERR